MNLKFWKRKESGDKGKGGNPHSKLDPEIREIPEIDHDVLLGLLKDADRIADEKFLADKYGLTPAVTREYTYFLTQKGLLHIYLKKDGNINRVELTEKGKSFLESAEQEKTV